MTKSEFLAELKERLTGVSEADLNRSLDYYTEMIEDRMEDGLSEEEAVKDVGTPAAIAEEILKEMPLDTLKIDKSFVDLIIGHADSKKTQVILRHIISMARELGIHCIAEGAEEHEQVLALQDLGCDTVQGYFFCKPIPIELFEGRYCKKSGTL